MVVVIVIVSGVMFVVVTVTIIANAVQCIDCVVPAIYFFGGVVGI